MPSISRYLLQTIVLKKDAPIPTRVWKVSFESLFDHGPHPSSSGHPRRKISTWLSAISTRTTAVCNLLALHKTLWLVRSRFG
ncbi:hypothetical protein BST61_g1275 [Cercospora zeina]